MKSVKETEGIDKWMPFSGNIADVSEELAEFEDAERERLGIAPEEKNHWNDANPTRFTAEQRATTTLLVSGLTVAHDLFIVAAFRGGGYKVKAMDCPDNNSLRLGKEFGNRGQCNPTYFTVGNLVKFLKNLREVEGLSKKEIVESYIYLTVGGCGPCRFNMYVTEYRTGLRDAGFEGFRVVVLSAGGGVGQDAGGGGGLDVSASLYIGCLKALIVGDVLNAIMYRIRPYEVQPGATDAAVERCREILVETFANNTSVLRAIWKCRKLLAAVQVDRTQIKPRVAIIGEFWAMTTEGDGNYKLQSFLEGEGAEVDIQLIVAWLLYTLWEVRFDTRRRQALRGADSGTDGLQGVNVRKRLMVVWLVEKLLRGVFSLYALTMGLKDYHLPDMDEMGKISNRYYNNSNRGGEGHMEVGKLIMNVIHNKVNMTLSVKPFGCMPSSGVSDGVQSIITELFPQAIFLPIETSGDGAVNVYSRVQMQLFKAKQAARREVDEALELYGVGEAEMHDYLARHPEFARSLQRSPHRAGCTAADLAHQVGRRIGRPKNRAAGKTAASAV
ncbi:MAG: 2-hydroxyglutaryl-CoA dehydratase [bacterium]